MTKQLALVALLSLPSCGLALAADPPTLVNYQGVLRDNAGKPVPDGLYSMVFRFYNAEGPGGDPIAVDAQNVAVAGGVFSVKLGMGLADGPGPGVYTSLTKVFADFAQLYLEVEVGGETLAPRILLASAGYALNTRRVRGVELISSEPLTLWVNGATGDDANDGLHPTRAKRTIQNAVNAIPPVLESDALVWIADGAYHEHIAIMPRTRTRADAAIRLYGNTDNPQNVVLDGTGAPSSSVDAAMMVLDAQVTIQGLTVQNFGGDYEDFGLQADRGAFVRVLHCRFVNNNVSVAALGAENGASILAGDVYIAGNTVGVSARRHGIIEAWQYTEILDNTVAGVKAQSGGLVSFTYGPCWIVNNLMPVEDHSTIRGYSLCTVSGGGCEPAEGDPTARCVP